MAIDRNAFVLAGLMGAASVAPMAVQPSLRVAEEGPRVDLETMVPKQFGTWHAESQTAPQVINPQARELLDKLYSQVLSRTYVSDSGYRVMLSIAYGGDQRGDLRAHKPEVCYPAYGFSLRTSEPTRIATRFGSITARRMLAIQGSRQEPVTYWRTVGNHSVDGGLNEKLVEMKFGLTGRIPDGLLFRVSSVDRDQDRANGIQDDFVRQMLESVSPSDRLRLSGLGDPG